jgi:hypothetical protein
MVQHLDPEQRLTGDKDSLNAIVAAHVFGASPPRANVDGASSVDFEISENLLSNFLCRMLRDPRLWASMKTCLCGCGLWTGISFGRPCHDENEKAHPDVAEVSESVIGLSRLSQLNLHLNVMRPRAISCVARLRRRSFVYAHALQRLI